MKADGKKAIKNVVIAVIYQVINLTVAVFLPRGIIYKYGSDVNGLTSNINQYLIILGLLQAGLMAASAFDMFKPLVEEDYKQVGTIFYSAKRTFTRLSYVFFVLAVVIMPIALGGRSETISMQQIIIAVILMTISGVLNFRFYCCFDLIFSVYQDKYILSIALLIEKTVFYLGVYLSIALDLHFLYMYVGNIVGTILKLFYLQYKFSSSIEKSIVPYKDHIGYHPKNQFHLFGNQIIFRIVDSLPVIVVTLVYNLVYASIYSIYILVENVFKSLFDAVLNSVAPSIGILYAGDNKKKCSETFDMVQSACAFLLNIVVVCISVLLLPFIAIYIGDGAEQSYICEKLALWISICTILYIYFSQFDLMVTLTGSYKLTFKRNVVFGVVTAVAAVCCAVADYQLIFMGVSVFYFFTILLRYRLINGQLFPLSWKCLARPAITLLIYVSVNTFISSVIFPYASSSMLHWLITAVLSGCCGVVISLVYMLLFDRAQIKKLVSVFILR